MTPARPRSNPANMLLVRVFTGCLGVAAVTFLCAVLPVNTATVGFSFLILVLVIAAAWGLVESAIASFVAMLCYNYFFLPPRGHITIADPQNWVALTAFLATALVASHLSDRAKTQNLEARRRQKETEQLYALSRGILLTDLGKPIGAHAARQIAQIFDSDTVILYDARIGMAFQGGAKEIGGIEAVLKQVVLHGVHQQDSIPGVNVWPIMLGGQTIGALAAAGIHLSDSAMHAMLNLVAIALERVLTAEAANKAEVARQNEEFKSMLLDAIAHEFKTPLTSIKAASTSLLTEGEIAPEAQREMAAIINEETDRLSLLVTEAVKMSQIEAGKVRPVPRPVSPETLLQPAIATFRGRGDHRIQVVASLQEMPVVFVDPELTSLALRQIIDNGLKYSPPSGMISLSLEAEQDRVLVRIHDEGPGIPEQDRDKVFDRFYRHSSVRGKVPGSGLGLHIAREIARAQGGDSWFEDGSVFCIALPRAAAGSQ